MSSANDPTFEEFVLIYNKFQDYPQAQVSHYLELARRNVPPKKWGTRAKQAVYLLTAHYLTLENQQDAQDVGMANAIGQGGSPIIPNWTDLPLTTTVYGSLFKEMRDTLPIPSSFQQKQDLPKSPYVGRVQGDLLL